MKRSEFNNAPMAAWAVTTILVLLFAVVPSTAFHLDIDDHSLERAEADSLADAVKAEQARERFNRAAARICGNAEWTEIGDGQIQCAPRVSGGKALVAKVQP